MREEIAGRTDRHNVAVVAVGITALLSMLVVSDVPQIEARFSVSYPDREMAVLSAQFAPPPVVEPAPHEPVGRPAVTDAEPVWQVTLPGGVEPREITTTPVGYLVRTRRHLLVLDVEGAPLWDYDLIDSSDPVKVGEDVVLVGREHPADDRWPQPQLIVALDLATGETRWEEDEASFWTAVEGTVYMSVCFGGQNGQIGDCQLSARDVRTNSVRWSTPTYASTQVRNVGGGLRMRQEPDYLVVASFPTGHTSRVVTTLDPSSGRQLGAAFQGQQNAATAPEVLVRIEEQDDNPADGCTAELTGYHLGSGDLAWQYTSMTSMRADGRSCGRHPDWSAGTGRLAVTNPDGLPEVLDVRTGEIVWTAPRAGRGLAATMELLVVLEFEGNRELVLYDLTSGEERWRAPGPPGEVDPSVSIRDETLVTYYSSTWYSEEPVGYDLATGDSWAYLSPSVRDALWTFGPGWLATCEGGHCRGYELR